MHAQSLGSERVGDLIRFAYETKSKHVSMRSAKKISWRRSSADGKKDYTPHIDDDIEWHWSIDGWGDKWVIKGMLAGAELGINLLLHGNPPDFQSEPTYYSTPTIHEVTEYSKNASKPMGWNTRPASKHIPMEYSDTYRHGRYRSRNKRLHN